MPKIKESRLFDCLNMMPKPGILGILTLGYCRIDWLVEKLCYKEFVYLNEAKAHFRVTKDPNFNEPGYIAVNELRGYWANSS